MYDAIYQFLVQLLLYEMAIATCTQGKRKQCLTNITDHDQTPSTTTFPSFPPSFLLTNLYLIIYSPLNPTHLLLIIQPRKTVKRKLNRILAFTFAGIYRLLNSLLFRLLACIVDHREACRIEAREDLLLLLRWLLRWRGRCCFGGAGAGG
jgi:hypothetical protein